MIAARPSGFTLIEMAVAMLVVALLLGSLIVPLTTQVEQRQISETQRTLEEIREGLVGFAVANGYIPCPDKTTSAGAGTANDGQEDAVGGGTCVSSEGNVPWVTLGVSNYSDPWGNRIRYRVSGNFAQRSPAATFTLTTASSLEVCAVASCASRLTATGDGPVAVILSHGRNGYGAISAATGNQNTASASSDEAENSDSDTTFVNRTISGAGAAAGEFDDVVVWLSRNLLLNRMVAASKLP